MPYTVFALKWRPQNFDEIIGQGHIVGTLKNAIEKGRLAHAYLFAGPRGVGKTSTARILAKALNCKDGPTVKPCQKCASCIEISQGRSLDVIEIDGASNRGIDEIRTLRENVKFSPTLGKFKIYIIDEVHMLTQEAFNALLKTLEEPPEFIKFFFATTQPNKVLATILSRCQRFDFRRIPLMELIAQLERIVSAEKIEVDKDVLFAVAKASDGSLRDAESLLDQLVSFSKGKLSLEDVVSVLGIVEQEVLFEITDKIIRKDAPGTLGLLNGIIDDGKDITLFLSNMIEHFRNLMVAKVARADSKLIDLPQEICERLWQQAHDFSLEEIFQAFNILVNTQEMAKRLDSWRIPLEVALVKLAHDKRNPGANPAKTRTAETENTHPAPAREADGPLKKEDTHRASLQEPAPPKTEPIDPAFMENIKSRWQNIIDAIGNVKMSIATFLSEGNPVKLENNILTVSFPKNYSLHKESLERKENKAIIERIIAGLFNANIRVSFVLSKETASSEEAQDNPAVRSALEAFKARVIKQ